MNAGLISVRYATALLEFAKDSNTVETVYAEAKLLTLMFSKMSDLRLMLANPVISHEAKRTLILNAAGGKVSQTFRDFTDLLLKNRRENLVQGIMLKFIDLYRKQKNIHYGVLTTAYEVDGATEKRLIKLVTDKVGGTLELEKIVEPEILGGFKLEVDNVRWDASVASQLKRIKSEYIERNRRIV